VTSELARAPETSPLRVVSSYDEFTRLEEVIVGNPTGLTCFHFDNSFNLFYWGNVATFLQSRNYFRTHQGAVTWPVIPISQRLMEELQEDIDELVRALTGAGVTVRRPPGVSGDTVFRTPLWESVQSAPLNVRDQAIVLGGTIVETAPHVRSRVFENDYLKPLFYEYFAAGANWLQMPRPTLGAGSLDPSYHELSPEHLDIVGDHHTGRVDGLGLEIVFDGAQCVRLGADVLVNVANRNHELGFDWLTRQFDGQMRFHRLNALSDGHIDSTLLPLRPGLWLVRDSRVLDALPLGFRDWDHVVAPPTRREMFPSYEDDDIVISSKFIDMNVLSVDEQTVVVNSLYPELIATLERIGFTVIPVRHRHRRFFGGGFHCFTLDVRRRGGPDSYR